MIKIWILTSRGVKPCGLVVGCYPFREPLLNQVMVWNTGLKSCVNLSH